MKIELVVDMSPAASDSYVRMQSRNPITAIVTKQMQQIALTAAVNSLAT